MPKPPAPYQRRYRGRIRSDVRSAFNHLQKLIAWNAKYVSGSQFNYPNQLAIPTDMLVIAGAATTLFAWLGQKGPIPSRAP